MMLNQQILNHATFYLYDRYQRHKGLFVAGWGKGQDPDNRCILGALYTGTCQDNEIHSHVKDILGFDATSNPFCQSLMYFNDMTAQAQDEGFLRGDISWEYIEEHLKSLADKYELSYISPEQTIKDLNKLRESLKNSTSTINNLEEIK